MVADGGLFPPIIPHVCVKNVYRLPRSLEGQGPPVLPYMVFAPTGFPTLITGDLNLHYHTSNPTPLLSDKEFRESIPFFSLASERDYFLLNIQGTYTRFSFTSDKRPEVLDLAFASPGLSPFVDRWSTPSSSTGSDHVPTQITLSSPHMTSPQPTLDWACTDWGQASPKLRVCNDPTIRLLQRTRLKPIWCTKRKPE